MVKNKEVTNVTPNLIKDRYNFGLLLFFRSYIIQCIQETTKGAIKSFGLLNALSLYIYALLELQLLAKN